MQSDPTSSRTASITTRRIASDQPAQAADAVSAPAPRAMCAPTAAASRERATDVGISGHALVPVAPAVVAPAAGNFRTTFVAPKPNSTVMYWSGVANRHIALSKRGITKIAAIDLPDADAARLRRAVNPQTAAFITPNHPEFFTDWMIDKEISDRFAPSMASWATHTVVNAHPLLQKFWLANNLIAQIPGDTTGAGKAYSIAWALEGNTVLLHPEGTVGWHGDWVAPLIPGVVDMAIEAARQAEAKGDSRPVYVAPMVWKLCFVKDEARALGKELDYIEKRLGLQTRTGEDLGQRVYQVYAGLLAKDAAKLGVRIDERAHYFDNQAVVLSAVTTALRNLVEADFPATTGDAIADFKATARLAKHWSREAGKGSPDQKSVDRLVKTGERVTRLTPEMYRGGRLTQEQIAENAKRVRNDYITRTKREGLAKMVPRPVGPRVAHIRVPDSVNIRDVWREASGDKNLRASLVESVRQRMQASLDQINREHPPVGPTVANPFLRTTAQIP